MRQDGTIVEARAEHVGSWESKENQALVWVMLVVIVGRFCFRGTCSTALQALTPNLAFVNAYRSQEC